mmetsp:Transcript_816/g.1952  ORF Transcript_816/g.1952 Transcript_816/m.1952 type:complete len:1250 (-) Transcript_816:553-4302(-)|eukprot:CAMPEP_0172453422 /NCGR_PEP_ID=MMETSP1065-20121228/10749_1 /TAXON_ID=265537 /ORGANISM="Amphiprora paludosa, Strain CCMP125" /LENGTH=1249 /DNA_ID=CAMNT_0013205601 /DNA_START=194 /DNA_END=3943 /DNA_ORIENTATION=+
MGVPAFFRWLSEKYPKIVQDVLEERVHLANPDGGSSSARLPFDSTRPNPSGLECDNLYIDMNGIIHPCSHPENGPQPKTEEEMFENVCRYVDRLFRVMRPRKLLYLAIDGVAPRAKMNQQRARRFRAAQEARELAELEKNVAQTISEEDGVEIPLNHKEGGGSAAWDSNVITPGTTFMVRLATFLRFYVRKRIAQDKAWKDIRVILSDASIPGEGEHKIMSHVRLQRAQPGYNPNTVHVLHGLDADLIMLALATHEAHFYISREEVLFGRKSMEMQETRQSESGFFDKQRLMDEAAGEWGMQLPENTGKALQRISIPILRDYLAAEFEPCLTSVPFKPSLERLIDDIVFMCFFVGNDFLPHLPSLDIRDGALDFLFNVYKRILPSLGDYITKSGGHVNLSHVDVILGEVGAIEDYVFAMKHDNEERMKQMKQQNKGRRGGAKKDAPPVGALTNADTHKKRGRSAKILEKTESDEAAALQRGHAAKEEHRQNQKNKRQEQKALKSASDQDNLKAALAFKQSLGPASSAAIKGELKDEKTKSETVVKVAADDSKVAVKADDDSKVTVKTEQMYDGEATTVGVKRENVLKSEGNEEKPSKRVKTEDGVGIVGEAEEEFDNDDAGDNDDEDETEDVKKATEAALESEVSKLVKEVDPNVAAAFKEKVKAAQQQKLDTYAQNVEDNVRLHESGWKDRYYTDKCKADDVEAHGGREHLFRSYVVGLCWVMKYYYDGCPSWKWYYPFHYGPFASDLKNIERFEKDVRAMESSKPFNPVEQLMAVLPSDSAHAIPKAARWLMCDAESPIIDFYPVDVPVDPNGKAMPWLWVVLLPFIEEDRLLDAMMPTMAKWSKDELLCNARGMDDGYLYIHKSHKLSAKLSSVIAKGKTAKDPKTRLTSAASYGAPGFSGSVRPPLSNELYPIDEEVPIPLPPTASNIEDPGPDGLFSDDIDANMAVCVAFSEPIKLPHKSIMLPGARPPPSVLSEEDKRIRRPRLGRGGTIANMGGGGGGPRQGQSHQTGYGSMNIGSYERDLANRNGRGNQMNQAGTRGWGAMEPTPKQRRPPHPNAPHPPPNPFMNNNQHHRPNNRQQYNAPPDHQQRHSQQQWSHQQQGGHQRQGHQGAGNHPGYGGGRQGYQQGQQHWGQQQQQHNWQQQHGPPQGYNNGQGRNQHQGGGSYQNGPTHNGAQQNQSGQQQHQRQGFSFRNQTHHNAGGHHPPPRGGGDQRSRASADAMQSLRAQLSSTLRQQQRGSGDPK